MMTRSALKILLWVLVAWVTQPAYADNWAEFSGAEVLREFGSDKSVEVELRPGVTARGQYNADGTAEIVAWGETFRRTWEVVGENQICYTAVAETNCFTFEQNQDVPGEYRARNVKTGELIEFHLSDTGPAVAVGEARPNSEGGLGAPSAQEVAAELSNPNSNMGSLTLLLNYVEYDGELPDAGNQSGLLAVFQPSLPYALSDKTNLFIRPAIPLIISQDVPTASGEWESEGVDLGDISFDASIFTSSAAAGAVYGGGLVGSIPTATNDALGVDQWLLGPEVIGAIVRQWGVFGGLVSHQWDVAGDSDFDTSVTAGQLFFVYLLKDGWQVTSSPLFSYDHEASSGNQWTIPLGLGVSKIAIIKGRPWQFGIEYQYYVESPDVFGPDWQIQFIVSPVVELPW